MGWAKDEVRTYSYNGAVQTDTLEPGTYKLECWGGQGGNVDPAAGALGGYVCGDIEITDNTDINIYVGGQGGGAPGWNGGGMGYYGGGGASDIRIGGTALTNRVIVGGGAGAGANRDYRWGGAGGGLVGGSGNNGVATGGTQSAGGYQGGVLGVGGSYDGAGGGGYYGGGGYAGNAGGAGGSSYYGTLNNASTTSGQRSGAGQIKITCLSLAGGASTRRRVAQII